MNSFQRPGYYRYQPFEKYSRLAEGQQDLLLVQEPEADLSLEQETVAVDDPVQDETTTLPPPASTSSRMTPTSSSTLSRGSSSSKADSKVATNSRRAQPASGGSESVTKKSSFKWRPLLSYEKIAGKIIFDRWLFTMQRYLQTKGRKFTWNENRKSCNCPNGHKRIPVSVFHKQ